MKINIHKSTIEPMIELCKKHYNGKMIKSDFVEMLNHSDYRVEFERYSSKKLPVTTISDDEFIEYFMNILSVEEENINNERLKSKHKAWMHFFNDIDGYKKNIDNFFSISDEEVNTIQSLLAKAFPEKLLNDIADIECLFTLSIGDSMGYPHKNYIHFDYLNLGLLDDKETFINFIAHEIHHIIYSKIMTSNLKAPFTPIEHFLMTFTYEGLAVKFCNNGSGSFTNALYDTTKNIGLHKDTWNHYEREFTSMFEKFKEDYVSIVENTLSLEHVDKLIRETWLTPNITSFIDGKEVSVFQYRTYYMGMQLCGKIYDEVGLEKMFDMFLNPNKFVDYVQKNIL